MFSRSPLMQSVMLAVAVLALSGPVSVAGPADKDLTVEELVARHLASIGAPEARAAISSRALNGTAQVIFRVGNHGQMDGGFSFISEGRKVRLGMHFKAADYNGEQLAFDGKHSSTGFLPDRVRSTLESVFYQYDFPIKEGLLGGVDSLAWPLLDLKDRRPRLEYTGLTDIGGRRLHEVKYEGRKGNQGYIVMLYFDPETFRHVRTIYKLRIGHLIGHDDLTSARQEPSYCDIEESFDDFKTVDGITLPHTYSLRFNLSRKDLSMLNEWIMKVNQVFHNRKLDPRYFMIK